MTINRSYKVGDQWKDTNSLNRDDLLVATKPILGFANKSRLIESKPLHKVVATGLSSLYTLAPLFASPGGKSHWIKGKKQTEKSASRDLKARIRLDVCATPIEEGAIRNQLKKKPVLNLPGSFLPLHSGFADRSLVIQPDSY